jgi:hypothetical protein
LLAVARLLIRVAEGERGTAAALAMVDMLGKLDRAGSRRSTFSAGVIGVARFCARVNDVASWVSTSAGLFLGKIRGREASNLS